MTSSNDGNSRLEIHERLIVRTMLQNCQEFTVNSYLADRLCCGFDSYRFIF